jgi:hypothetical protein
MCLQANTVIYLQINNDPVLHRFQSSCIARTQETHSSTRHWRAKHVSFICSPAFFDVFRNVNCCYHVYEGVRRLYTTDVFNCEVLCSLCGPDWMYKYYLDHLTFRSRNVGKIIERRTTRLLFYSSTVWMIRCFLAFQVFWHIKDAERCRR